jgi:hypothetical protein
MLVEPESHHVVNTEFVKMMTARVTVPLDLLATAHLGGSENAAMLKMCVIPIHVRMVAFASHVLTMIVRISLNASAKQATLETVVKKRTLVA